MRYSAQSNSNHRALVLHTWIVDCFQSALLEFRKSPSMSYLTPRKCKLGSHIAWLSLGRDIGRQHHVGQVCTTSPKAKPVQGRMGKDRSHGCVFFVQQTSTEVFDQARTCFALARRQKICFHLISASSLDIYSSCSRQYSSFHFF